MASSSRFTRRQLSIDCEDGKDNILHMVVPRLYIGSIYAALEREQMKEKGITHILNASRFQSTFPEDFTYLSIDIKDKDDSNILPCIPSANIFIEAGMQSGGVLVHCYGGRSRSAAFIASYMMSSSGLGYDEVYRSIKEARPIVAINKGFELCLRAYAQTNHDVYSAHQVLLKGRIRHLHTVRARSVAARCGEVSGHKRSFGETENDNMFKSPRNTVEFYKSPKCVLSKPGSSSLRIMPPLKGLDRSFCCSWCGALLFNMSNVIRLDLDIVPILENLSEPKGDHGGGDQKKYSPVSGGAMAMDIDEGGRGNTFLHTDKDYSSFAQSESKSIDADPFSAIGAEIVSGGGDAGDNDSLDSSMKSDGFEYSPIVSVVPPLTSRASSGAKGFDFDEPLSRIASDGRLSLKDSDRASSAKVDSLSQDQTQQLQLPLNRIIRHKPAAAPSTNAPRDGPSIKDYESPRIPVPAGRLRESWSPQQQTKEKRRWLARINLLDRPGSAVSEPVAQLAEADDEAATLGFGDSKYIHLEYLRWMGPEVIHGEIPEGDVKCHSCKNVLGSWGWNPHPRHTMNGRLEAPLCRVLKCAVQDFDAPLDETPAGTPRRPSTSETK